MNKSVYVELIVYLKETALLQMTPKIIKFAFALKLYSLSDKSLVMVKNKFFNI